MKIYLAALIVLLCGAPAQAQIEEEDLGVGPGAATTPQNGELAELERMADESFSQDDLDTAVALYRQVVRLQSDRSERVRLLMTVAYLEHLLGRRNDAVTTLMEVLSLEPRHRLRADLYDAEFAPLFYDAQKTALEQRERDALRNVRLGFEALRRQDTTGARQGFEAALASWPDQPEALYNLALVDLGDGRRDEALAGFQKILALHGARPDTIDDGMRSLALTNVGLIYLGRDQNAEAEELLAQAVVADPTHRAAWSNLGIARRRLDRPADAADAFRRAWELSSDDPATTNNLALAYIDARDWVSAVAMLREATRRFPQSASLWLNLGLAQKGLGNAEAAVRAFGEAIRQDPGNGGGWAASAALHLAGHHYAAGAYTQALENADLALGWRDDLLNARVYQGLSRQALGDLQGARQSFEAARLQDPTQAEVHNNLGSVYFQLGSLDEAESAFRRALEIRPNFTNARDNLDSVAQARRQGFRPGSKAVLTQPGGGSSATRSQARPGTRPSTPTPPRLDLGIRFSDVDYAALGLRGVMVERVYPATAASEAGIRENDLLLRVDGREIADEDQLLDYVAQKGRGQSVSLSLLRDNRPVTVQLDVP
ncbi:MAG: tetratricopeptide repeat protein [Acidobacteriota bacterium]